MTRPTFNDFKRKAMKKPGVKREYSHDEVFGEIRQSPFTIKEASEYLEVAEITVRRWVKTGKLNARRVGKNIVFNVKDLKRFKKNNV